MRQTYDVIYADPPWKYRDKGNSGKRGVGFKYDLMSMDDLKQMPIIDIASDDCALFMWATFPLIAEALDLIDAWGFNYKTVAFNWIKMNKIKPTPFWGMGNWTRSNSEICLLATRGKPKRVSASVHSVIMSPIRKHSQKPDEVRESIDKLMGDVRKIELFARGECAVGWDCWGNQAINGVELL